MWAHVSAADQPCHQSTAKCKSKPTAPPFSGRRGFRATQPTAEGAARPVLRDIKEGRLSNGIRVLFAEDHQIPMSRLGFAGIAATSMHRRGRWTCCSTPPIHVQPSMRYEATSGLGVGFQPLLGGRLLAPRDVERPPLARGPARFQGGSHHVSSFDGEELEGVEKARVGVLKQQSEDGMEKARDVARKAPLPAGPPLYSRGSPERIKVGSTLKASDLSTFTYRLVAQDDVSVVAVSSVIRTLELVTAMFERTLGSFTGHAVAPGDGSPRSRPHAKARRRRSTGAASRQGRRGVHGSAVRPP